MPYLLGASTMANWFNRALNVYVRFTGKVVNGLLVIMIFVLYGFELASVVNLPVQLEVVLFVLLIINNLLFLIYAVILRAQFDQQVHIYLKRGIPLESTEGFKYSRTAVDNSVNRSTTLNFLIIAGTVLHFSIDFNPAFDTLFVQITSYFGISLVLIGMSLFLQIEYPDHSLLEPGNFISYHQPKSTPTFLDNLLADSIKSFLDPRTRYQFDNWELDLKRKLNPEFEPNRDLQTRIERAIERIILLEYLNMKASFLVTDDILLAHFKQIIREDEIDDFISGEDSELPIDVFGVLVYRMSKDIPEIFQLVDRLLVEIMVNPSVFEKSDRIIETVIPDEDTMGVKESFRVLIYVLNMAESDQHRVIEVLAESSRDIEPPKSSVRFKLDDPDPQILELIQTQKRSRGDLVYSDRIIDILSMMLQVGDSTWLQFIPQEYGKHVLNLAVIENDMQSYGSSVPIDVQFSLKNNLRKFLSSLSGIGGAIYPILKALLFNPLF